MLGVKSFDPCREFGCFQSLFFIVVDHCVPFTLAVVKSQVVLQSPFVERFRCIYIFHSRYLHNDIFRYMTHFKLHYHVRYTHLRNVLFASCYLFDYTCL